MSRAPHIDRQMADERRVAKLLRQAPRDLASESVDDFLARGGVIERLSPESTPERLGRRPLPCGRYNDE